MEAAVISALLPPDRISNSCIVIPADVCLQRGREDSRWIAPHPFAVMDAWHFSKLCDKFSYGFAWVILLAYEQNTG